MLGNGEVEGIVNSAFGEFLAKYLEENPKSVAAFHGGKEAALQHLVGQVMRLSRGKANPKVVLQLLRDKLAD